MNFSFMKETKNQKSKISIYKFNIYNYDNKI